jgi:hypothetical protein
VQAPGAVQRQFLGTRGPSANGGCRRGPRASHGCARAPYGWSRAPYDWSRCRWRCRRRWKRWRWCWSRCSRCCRWRWCWSRCSRCCCYRCRMSALLFRFGGRKSALLFVFGGRTSAPPLRFGGRTSALPLRLGGILVQLLRARLALCDAGVHVKVRWRRLLPPVEQPLLLGGVPPREHLQRQADTRFVVFVARDGNRVSVQRRTVARAMGAPGLGFGVRVVIKRAAGAQRLAPDAAHQLAQR